MQRHTWRERTEEGVRFFRASYHAGTWTLQSQLKGEEEWAPRDPITKDEWRMLRDVLWRRYQRGRGAWKLIEKIDQLLDPSSLEGDGLRRNGSEEGDPSASSPLDETTS